VWRTGGARRDGSSFQRGLDVGGVGRAFGKFEGRDEKDTAIVKVRRRQALGSKRLLFFSQGNLGSRKIEPGKLADLRPVVEHLPEGLEEGPRILRGVCEGAGLALLMCLARTGEGGEPQPFSLDRKPLEQTGLESRSAALSNLSPRGDAATALHDGLFAATWSGCAPAIARSQESLSPYPWSRRLTEGPAAQNGRTFDLFYDLGVRLPPAFAHCCAVTSLKPSPLQEFWPLQSFFADLQSD
jgi:hypothetical protein